MERFAGGDECLDGGIKVGRRVAQPGFSYVVYLPWRRTYPFLAKTASRRNTDVRGMSINMLILWAVIGTRVPKVNRLDHVHDIRVGWSPHDCLIEYPGQFQAASDKISRSRLRGTSSSLIREPTFRLDES